LNASSSPKPPSEAVETTAAQALKILESLEASTPSSTYKKTDEALQLHNTAAASSPQYPKKPDLALQTTDCLKSNEVVNVEVRVDIGQRHSTISPVLSRIKNLGIESQTTPITSRESLVSRTEPCYKQESSILDHTNESSVKRVKVESHEGFIQILPHRSVTKIKQENKSLKFEGKSDKISDRLKSESPSGSDEGSGEDADVPPVATPWLGTNKQLVEPEPDLSAMSAPPSPISTMTFPHVATPPVYVAAGDPCIGDQVLVRHMSTNHIPPELMISHIDQGIRAVAHGSDNSSDNEKDNQTRDDNGDSKGTTSSSQSNTPMVDAVEYQSPTQGIVADGQGAGGAGGDDHNNKRPRRTSGHRDEDAYTEARQSEDAEGEERAPKKARLMKVQDVNLTRFQEKSREDRPAERLPHQSVNKHMNPYTASTQQSPSYRQPASSELPSIIDNMRRDNHEYHSHQKQEFSLPSISSIMSPISPMRPSSSNETDKLAPMDRWFDFSQHEKRKSIDNRSDTDIHKSSPLGPNHLNITSPPRLRTQLSSGSSNMGDSTTQDMNRRSASHYISPDRKKWSHIDSPSKNASSSLQTPGPSPATPYGSYPHNIMSNTNSPVQYNNTSHMQNRPPSRQSSRSTVGESWVGTPYSVGSRGEMGKSTSASPIPRQNSTGSKGENNADAGGAGVGLGNTYKCDYPGCTAAPFQTQYLLKYATSLLVFLLIHLVSHGRDSPFLYRRYTC